MSLGTLLLIILVIFLLGGFSGRFGGYGYGFGHTGIGVLGVVLIVVLVLLVLGRIRSEKGRRACALRSVNDTSWARRSLCSLGKRRARWIGARKEIGSALEDM